MEENPTVDAAVRRLLEREGWTVGPSYVFEAKPRLLARLWRKLRRYKAPIYTYSISKASAPKIEIDYD